MKKLFFVASALMVGFAYSADTDLLVWTIDTAQNTVIGQTAFDSISKFYLKSTTSDKVFSLAGYTYGDENLTIPVDSTYSYGLTFAFEGWTDSYYTDVGRLYSDIAAYSGLDDISAIDKGAWEFYMQLDNNGNMVAWSEHMFNPTADATGAVYLSDVAGSILQAGSNMMDPKAPSAFNFGMGSRLVPEPTSGLLLMMGAGLLALRRRRRA